MKNLFIAFIFGLFFCSPIFAQTGELNIIPRPKLMKRTEGEFKLNFKTKIVATDEAGRKSAGILNDLLLKNYGFKLEYTDKAQKKNAIVFSPLTSPADTLPPEGYGLTVSPLNVRIFGTETGHFYALQTLMQLLPVDFKGEAKLPAVEILDAPRFSYRGMHLDVGRHFFPVEFVKKYIDLMAQYKFNQFHWHLTEDQGWRIEIKKYPKLTEIGSRRKETQKEKNRVPFIGDGVPVEGFYTQEQIKEVVDYAKARRINVIPEIELPGHSSAALAAYPELGCKESYEYKVQPTWGIFKEVYCPTDATFKFLEDVLEETIALFPDSPYIHIGGDEVLKDHWKESAFVQELKAKENLKDEHEVQSYFIRRMEKFINSKGKKIIGWDEILEGGLAPNATVMSWRGEKGGIEAAKAKHDVIMTPTDYLYFDYGQGDTKTEPLNIGNYLPLEKVYSYNPQSKELTDDEKKYVLGAQGNVWTEYMKTPEKVEYMVFPRMLALAEVVWSPLEKKDYADFQMRLSTHFPRLDKQNVNYRIPEPINLQNEFLNAGKNEWTAQLMLISPLRGSRIFYTLDGSEPTEKSSLRTQPFINIPVKRGEKVDLKTIVVLANGRKSAVYTATFLGREPLKPVENFQSTTAGMNFAFFKGEFKSVKEFDNATPQNTGETKNFAPAQFKEKENFGVTWEGYLSVPADGIYEFWLESKDGAVIRIDDEPVVDLDGAHEKKNAFGDVPLKAGFHRFRLQYFHTTGEPVLSMRYGIKNQPLRFFANQIFR
jgi:hexosaminidase